VLALEPSPVELDVPARASQRASSQAHPGAPVGELLDEGEQGRDDVVELVRRHLLPDEADEGLTPGEDPAVKDVGRDGRGGVVAELDAVVVLEGGDGGEEEAKGVEPGDEDLGEDLFDAGLAEAEVVAADDGGIDEEEPEGVGAVALHDVVGIGVVLQALAHLLAVPAGPASAAVRLAAADALGEDEAADDEVLPRRRLPEVRREDEQGVEPASRLVPEREVRLPSWAVNERRTWPRR
jgi:hypothetical protein